MALKGNLRDFSITHLLNLIHLARKTGSLTVERPGETARIYFRDGTLSYANFGVEDNSLIAVLYKANKISSSQQRAIQARAGGISDKELGLLLINSNYITRQDVLEILKSNYVDKLNQIFTWEDGNFHFENEVPPPKNRIPIRVQLEDLILEGARRLEELDTLQEEIPSLDMALKFSNRPGTNIRNLKLTRIEWRVINYISPRNTIRQIARATKLNDLEIRKIIYSLLQAGLVEIVRPNGKIHPTPLADRPSKSSGLGEKEQGKSLINRIIERLRSL